MPGDSLKPFVVVSLQPGIIKFCVQMPGTSWFNALQILTHYWQNESERCDTL